MKKAFHIRASVKGRVIADVPVGVLFLLEAIREGAPGQSIDASGGVKVQIVEDDEVILERIYAERELYPYKDADG
jgi:hypothetical protein